MQFAAAPDVVWSRGSVHVISWSYPANDDFVEIDASFDRGVTWARVGAIGTIGRKFLWTIPETPGAQARLRLNFKTVAPGSPVITDVTRVETADVTLGPSTGRDYTWSRVQANAPFGVRDGAGGLSYDGKMWLIGGWGNVFPANTANDVWSSVDGTTWTLEKPNTFLDPHNFDDTLDWKGRHVAGYQVFGGKMWILGGDAVQGFYQTDVWNSVDGKRWTRADRHTTTPRTRVDTNPASDTFGQPVPVYGYPAVEEAQFGMRTLHMTSVHAGKLWIMGGQRSEEFVDPEWPGRPWRVFNDVWSSGDGSEWSEVRTVGDMWAPRGMAEAAVSFKGKMWVVGGGVYGFGVPEGGGVFRPWEFRNDVWSTPDGIRWTKEPEPAPWSERVYHNVIVADDRIWVINGMDLGSGNRGDAWYTSDGGKNWYDAKVPEDFVPRHAGTSWSHNGSVYVGSGAAAEGDPADPTGQALKWIADVWRASPPP